ncbi:MAG: hypothetical protein NTV81_03455 [Candidatus Komeilibacteria bacterium]|nr:hypothetical protein [Candidatus Komeilibacteria bacterium]
MYLSALQRYILQTTLLAGRNKVARQVFYRFYQQQASPPVLALQINAITKSLERLIAKKLIIGFGEVTACKWFIREIQLTAAGKKVTKQLFGQQIILPLKR